MSRALLTMTVVGLLIATAGAACASAALGLAYSLSCEPWIWSAHPYSIPAGSTYWMQVRVDGERTAHVGRYVVKLGGADMLPLDMLGALGIDSEVGADGLSITLSGGGRSVRLEMYSKRARVGWRRRELSAYPRWHDGKRYVPLDFLAEVFGMTLGTDPVTGGISVTTK